MRSKRSLEGLIKQIEISENNLFLFVEGKEIDPRFYDKVFDHLLFGLGVKYEIILPSKYVDGYGGKDGLLKFHDELKYSGRLQYEFKKIKKSIIFILDKDVDDIINIKRCEPNIIYTRHYCAENYLILHNDIKTCIMNSCQIPKSEIGRLKDNIIEEIRRGLKPWVVYCLAGKMKKMHACPGYGHQPPIGFELSEKCIESTAIKCGMPESDVKLAFKVAGEIVDLNYSAGTPDVVIKGKWYFSMMETIVKEHYDGYNIFNFNKSIQSAMLASLQINDEWAIHFKIDIMPSVNFLLEV